MIAPGDRVRLQGPSNAGKIACYDNIVNFKLKNVSEGTEGLVIAVNTWCASSSTYNIGSNWRGMITVFSPSYGFFSADSSRFLIVWSQER